MGATVDLLSSPHLTNFYYSTFPSEEDSPQSKYASRTFMCGVDRYIFIFYFVNAPTFCDVPGSFRALRKSPAGLLTAIPTLPSLGNPVINIRSVSHSSTSLALLKQPHSKLLLQGRMVHYSSQ